MKKSYSKKHTLIIFKFKELLLSTALLFTALLFLASGAQATLITFDLSGTASPSDQKVFTDLGTGASLTVTALVTPFMVPIRVTQTPLGLGARVTGFDTNPQLDSVGPNEALVFTISGVPGLRLEEFLFGSFEGGSDFSFYVDTLPPDIGEQILGPGFGPANPWDVSDDLSDAERTAYASFAIKVNDIGGTEAFRIQEITANVVPEPATVLLVGSGLIGLVGYRRKFRRK
jgi:hypothetical protein